MTLAPEPRNVMVFTPALANAALPYVRAVVEDIVEAFMRLRAAESLRQRLDRGDADARPKGVSREDALYEVDRTRTTARRDLDRAMAELAQTGVELKDPRRGLIDFPGEMDGRPIYLCWVRGEESVAWWHSIDEGFSGRKPLPDAAPPSSGDGVPEGDTVGAGPDAGTPRRSR